MMAFINFFRKKTKHTVNTAEQSIYSGIGERLTEICERLRRIENRQKETSLQLDEIDGFLQDGSNESVMVEALTALLDIIGDFYYFAVCEEDSPLFEQARMMWDAAKNAAEAVGLEIIDAVCEPFDFSRHSTEVVEQDYNMPNSYVIKTLKCGYIYKDEIIRKAFVVVNKIDERITTSEIIN